MKELSKKENKIDISSIKKPKGEITSEPSQLAEVFASFFSKVAENLAKKLRNLIKTWQNPVYQIH